MISIIIPFYNEEESLPALINQCVNELKTFKDAWEIILVDDGSNDSSKLKVSHFVPLGGTSRDKQSEQIKLISHRKRFGKGKALQTGIDNSSGDVIVFMDGDLQDDPEDLKKFIDKLNQGYDFVNGIRVKRQENIVVKAYSFFAKIFLHTFLRSPFTDINCGFKAFRKTVLEEIVLYGNNFRFLPLAAYYQGFKVTEITVNNRSRQFGQSKFGSKKLIGGIFDTLTAYFVYRFAEKPLHFFGPIGGTMLFTGSLISVVLAYERIFYGSLLYRRPMLFLGILLIIVGVQIVMTGIVGELIVYLNKKSNIR